MLVYAILPPPITPLIIIRSSQQIFKNEDPAFTKSWTNYNNISKNMVDAVVASEDQYFYTHAGFDFSAIKKVRSSNKKKKRIKGASTISQQTAKNLFLWPARNYFRKFLEAYFTIFIEALWSKKRIIEVYLNSIEYGNGIYGIRAATEYYFNKPPDKLSIQEAALIAAILPNPIKYSAKKPTPYILKRQQWILKNMKNLQVNGNSNSNRSK